MPKLLLADDSVTIQRVIELTFADEQIQVIAVGDGQQAIHRIETEKPDVVLADVGMPERDGYEVAAHVKGSPHLAHIPVILLTGAFEPIDEARARSVGCDGVLVKPFEPQMVINRVRDLLAGRRPASLWATAPGAPAPVAAAAPAPQKRDVSVASPDAAAAADRSAPIESLDEYFDRLDAAFSHAETAPAAQKTVAAAPVEPPAQSRGQGAAHAAPDFGDWDIAVDRQTSGPAPAPRSPEPARERTREAVKPASGPAPVAAAPPIGAPVRKDAPTPGPVEPPAAARVEASAPSRVEGTAAGHAEAAPQARADAAVPAAVTAPAPSKAEGPAPSKAETPAAAHVELALAEAFAALLAAEQGQTYRPGSGQAAGGAGGSLSGAGPANEAQVEEIVRRVLARMTDSVVRQTVLPIAERLVREEIDRVKKGPS